MTDRHTACLLPFLNRRTSSGVAGSSLTLLSSARLRLMWVAGSQQKQRLLHTILFQYFTGGEGDWGEGTSGLQENQDRSCDWIADHFRSMASRLAADPQLMSSNLFRGLMLKEI